MKRTFRPDWKSTYIMAGGTAPFVVAPLAVYWEYRRHPAIVVSTVLALMVFVMPVIIQYLKTITITPEKFNWRCVMRTQSVSLAEVKQVRLVTWRTDRDENGAWLTFELSGEVSAKRRFPVGREALFARLVPVEKRERSILLSISDYSLHTAGKIAGVLYEHCSEAKILLVCRDELLLTEFEEGLEQSRLAVTCESDWVWRVERTTPVQVCS